MLFRSDSKDGKESKDSKDSKDKKAQEEAVDKATATAAGGYATFSIQYALKVCAAGAASL